MSEGLYSCRGCEAPSKTGDPHLMLCDECLNRLSQSAKMRSPILNKELKRIRNRNFTEDEINHYLASILDKKAMDTLKHKVSNLTIEEAKLLGLKRYHTGVVCAQGHGSERFVCNGKCVQCCLELHKKIRANKASERVKGRPGWLSMKSPGERLEIEDAIRKGVSTSIIARTHSCHRNTVIKLKREIRQS